MELKRCRMARPGGAWRASTASDLPADIAQKGTARMIIDLLPRVTPVEEPKPSK
jgi:hypothetical protein